MTDEEVVLYHNALYNWCWWGSYYGYAGEPVLRFEACSVTPFHFKKSVARTLEGVAGVYTIFTKTDCYVGKSENLSKRLRTHLGAKAKAWDVAFYIAADKGLINSLETWALRSVLRAGLPVLNNAPTARAPGDWAPPGAVYWSPVALHTWSRAASRINE